MTTGTQASTPATELRQQILELTERFHDAREAGKAFVPGVTPVRYAGRVFDAEELSRLVDASLDFWLTAGRYAEEFEHRLAQFVGVESAFAVNSGSSANLVALASLTSPLLGERRLRPGDEVVMSAAGFPTTLNPVLQYGLVPVFVDVELGTYTPSAAQLAAAIGPRTRALMIAHPMGNPLDLAGVLRLVQEQYLFYVEDTCDALGSRYDGRLTGTFGHVATCSFYPAHHITTGEGGAVFTSDPVLARAAQSLRDWGRDCYCSGGESNTCGKRFGQQLGRLPFGYDHKYVYSHIGYNLKLTDMQAAIGCAQLDKLPGFIRQRRENHAAIVDGLRAFEEWLVLPTATPNSEPCWFGVVLTVREGAGFTRRELVQFLEDRRIETRPLFAGNLLRHPAYEGIPHRVVGALANADRITESTFFVGCYPGIGPEQIDYVLDTFRAFFAAR